MSGARDDAADDEPVGDEAGPGGGLSEESEQAYRGAADDNGADGTDTDGADADEGPIDGAAGGQRQASTPWWRVRLSTRSGVLIGVLLALLGFAVVAQVKSNDQDDELATARQEDLVQILDDLDSRKERLQREISSLHSQQEQISSGRRGRQAALSSARRRADELGILAGTLPADGPGLSIRLTAGHHPIDAAVVLDAVEELRGAGAEAMQIAGAGVAPVRVVASTSFVNSGRGLLVGSARLSGPYTVAVIGDPDTMQAALNIPGGVVDTVRQAGGSVSMQEPDVVHVSAVRKVHTPRYARPVS